VLCWILLNVHFRSNKKKTLPLVSNGPEQTLASKAIGLGFLNQRKTEAEYCAGVAQQIKRPRRFSPSGFFLGFFCLMSLRIGPCRPVPPPPLEWTSFPPLVTAVLITPKGAESPGSRRIRVIGVLAYFLACETV